MEIMTQIRKDVAFFRRNDIMDYSMLAFKINHTDTYHKDMIRVYGKTPKNNLKQFKTMKDRMCFTNKEIYWHIGIIDYLEKFTVKKRFERYWKRCIKRKTDCSSKNAV